mmetsp:Transcript_4114/g.9235  ORF Transcript_4114/g.9235 Transcript_4114/m.9235 type:complete len:362 (-) Transcript_4114:62-1147(-)
MDIDNEQQHQAKRLRSSEPDLKVVLGSGDDAATIWCHSPSLASKSKYVDAILSTPMKEKEARTTTFPDITPGIWHGMIKFLDSPIAARKMNARDALKMAVYYDKCDFEEGRALCDHLLVEYLESVVRMEEDHSIDINLVVNAVVVAHEANLVGAQGKGLHYVVRKITDSRSVPYGRTMFTEEHMKKLVPFLSKANLSRFGLLGRALHKNWDIDQPAFPQMFVSDATKMYEESLLHQCISHIQLSGTMCNADGVFIKPPTELMHRCYEYASDRTFDRGNGIMHFLIKQVKHVDNDDNESCNWAIVARHSSINIGELKTVEEVTCWVAPYSTNMHLPPRNGWKSSNPLARGNPTLKYILKDKL